MDPKTTALVLIEFQNDFTSDGGTLHGAVKGVMDSTNMLANTVETVKGAREQGATIVFMPISFTDDYNELAPSPYGHPQGSWTANRSARAPWGAGDRRRPQAAAEDIIVEGKARPVRLCQHQPRLHPAQPQRQTVASAGSANVCVESTMRIEKGWT
jgi:ureidoacrylate peracid hydrolase